MSILDALGLKAVGFKRSLVLPSLFTWLFSKNRNDRRPISYLGFFVVCSALTYAHIQRLHIVTLLESSFLDMAAPIVSAIQKPFHAVRNFSHRFTDTQVLLGEIEHLKRQNDNLLLVNAALRQSAFVVKDVSSKVSFVESLSAQLPESQLLHHKYHATTTLNQPELGRPLFINISKEMGTEKNDIVLGAYGIIGRVSKSGLRTAQVVTLSDPTFRIPVEVKGIQAIAAGNGTETLALTHIKDAQHSINVGDVVVTSGFGGVYPKGLPVGVITSIENKLIHIRPFENERNHHTVILIKASPEDLPPCAESDTSHH